MKKTLLTISIMAGLMMTACVKESANEQMGLPEGAMMLTTEGFQGHNTKTSVSGTSVQWVGDGTEKVYLNGNEYTVGLTGGNAYVTASDADKTGETYGYTGLKGTPTWTSGTKTLSVTVPAEYTSSYSGGRQVIALPMVAYKDATADKIEFKHVTAAVKVRIKNTVGEAVYLDKVVVKSAGKKLNGDVDVVLTNVDGMSTQTTSTASEKQVTVYFAFNTVTINNYNDNDANIKEVQVPILPLEASDLTVEVYTHKMVDHSSDNSGLLSVSYSYNFSGTKNVAQDIERNVMLTAGVNIQTHTVSPTTMNEVDHSLFTVASGKKVRFSMGNLQYYLGTVGEGVSRWSFKSSQYARSTSIPSGYYTMNTTRPNQDGYIDLFGWGASEIEGSATKYHPWLYAWSGKFREDVGAADMSTTIDWGYNKITNGGNVQGNWRTLTSSEWSYLWNTRTVDGYALPISRATVQGVPGLIILPDDFNDPMTNSAEGHAGFYPGPNSTTLAGYTENVYSGDGWIAMEASGAVFLPVCGYRSSSSLNKLNENYVWYWTATSESNAFTHANALTHNANSNKPSINSTSRLNGLPVRLVKNAN